MNSVAGANSNLYCPHAGLIDVRTLRELALRHMQQNGMTQAEATAALDEFSQGAGRDVNWRKGDTSMGGGLMRRVDIAAVNWCVAHRLTGETVVEPEARMIRDGKMLATGEV